MREIFKSSVRVGVLPVAELVSAQTQLACNFARSTACAERLLDQLDRLLGLAAQPAGVDSLEPVVGTVSGGHLKKSM